MTSTVAIARQADYDRDTVFAAVQACIDRIGGMAAFVKPGQRVLLKPNVLSAVPPDRAVTTHPSIVAAVIQLVRNAGGKPFIAESTGIGAIQTALNKSGIEAVMNEYAVPLGACDEEHVFECTENTVVKRLPLMKAVADADVVISLPKLKTHVQMTFTGAIKNQFGLVPGIAKGQYHFRFQDRARLAELFLDIHRVAKPALAIMDAIVGMEGDGPGGGDPRKIGIVMASADLMALDVVACQVIGLDPATVPTIQAGTRLGVGTTDPKAITIAGVPLNDVKIAGYKLVAGSADILGILPFPSFLLRWFRNQWVARPRIVAATCIKCLACKKGCPVTPATIDPDLPHAKQVDDRRCIRCYCCHEFCPVKAITLKRSLLDRMFSFTRSLNWLGKRA